MRIPTRSNTIPPGGVKPAGTYGGRPAAAGGAGPGIRLPAIGDVPYLWVLVALEVGAMVWGRQVFRRYHGG